MKRIVVWVASTVTVLVLLFSYHTSTNRTVTEGSTGATGPAVPGSGSTGRAPSTGGNATALPGTKTYTGPEADTRWGLVRVRITVRAGRVTAVDVPEYPQGNPRDEEINRYALPVLIKETLAAQSAQIDMVSGATVTSGGYLQSLQAALDAAGIS